MIERGRYFGLKQLITLSKTKFCLKRLVKVHRNFELYKFAAVNDLRQHAKSKLELNSKKVELE